MNKHDGGPAFPIRGIANDEDQDFRFVGMTLRDWFAGQVVQECLSQHGAFNSAGVRKSVEQAYLIADAMLAERGK